MQHAWEGGKMHTAVLFEKLKERDHLENLIINGRIISK
jgi:hypothetical protein